MMTTTTTIMDYIYIYIYMNSSAIVYVVYQPFLQPLAAVGIRLLDGDRNADPDPRRLKGLLVDPPLEDSPEASLSEHRVRPEVPRRFLQLPQREYLQVRGYHSPHHRRWGFRRNDEHPDILFTAAALPRQRDGRVYALAAGLHWKNDRE